MSNELSEKFKESLLNLVNTSHQHYSGDDHDFRDDPAVDILDFREETYNDGYCETCWYEYTVVEIDYRSRAGERGTFVYGDDFADLVNELVRQ